MKWRRMLAVILVIIAVVNIPTVSGTFEKTKIGGAPIQPLALFHEGTHRSTEPFVATYTLNANNGSYFNFYVNNLGSCSVKISIEVNGVEKASKTYAPGNGGHIYVEVTNGLFGGSKSYTVKCTPYPANGAEMYVYLKAAQRTELTG